MSGRPSWKSAEIGLFRPFSAFFALFRRVRRAPGKSRKRRKKAFFLRYPQICLNPHLLNPHLRHSKSKSSLENHGFFGGFFLLVFPRKTAQKIHSENQTQQPTTKNSLVLVLSLLPGTRNPAQRQKKIVWGPSQ